MGRLSPEAQAAVEAHDRAHPRSEAPPPAPPRPPRKGGRQPDPELRARYVEASAGGTRTLQEIAGLVGVKYQTAYSYVSKNGIAYAPAPKGKRKAKAPDAPLLTPGGAVSRDKAAIARHARAERGVAAVSDRRRFKTVPVPVGVLNRVLSADNPAVVDARPMFPTRLLDAADPATDEFPILVDGASNAKIGGDVMVGPLAGARIFTVTLAERTTCPRSCEFWLSCYGNGDPHARRWMPGPAFERRLEEAVVLACTRHDKVLVRLHYLGDFYSAEYVDLWAQLLADFDNLHAFGFTAHRPDSRLGALINAWREVYGYRFAIRHSDEDGDWGAFTVDFPTEKKRLGRAIVCVEQRDAMSGGAQHRHCGSCAVCWTVPNAIVFVEH